MENALSIFEMTVFSLSLSESRGFFLTLYCENLGRGLFLEIISTKIWGLPKDVASRSLSLLHWYTLCLQQLVKIIF